MVPAGTALDGAASIGSMGGGPLCAPVTVGCGAAVIASVLTFVGAYGAMQGMVNGNQALQAVGSGAALAAGELARWSSRSCSAERSRCSAGCSETEQRSASADQSRYGSWHTASMLCPSGSWTNAP
jgi:hypothetical protein